MKAMKTVFVLVVISVMAMSVGSANAALFETGFEDYTTGPSSYASVVGQDGWVGWNSPSALVAYSDLNDYMPGYNWLYLTGVGRDTNALYRSFAAQTGQVRLEVIYQPYQSNTSWRYVSLRDSSSDNADYAAMIGTSKNYGSGYREFFAYDGEGRQWAYTGSDIEQYGYYKIVIDANVATQTYDATVYTADYFTLPWDTVVASWTVFPSPTLYLTLVVCMCRVGTVRRIGTTS